MGFEDGEETFIYSDFEGSEGEMGVPDEEDSKRVANDKSNEPIIVETTHRWQCPKCENEWQAEKMCPCPKCDRENFLRQRYKELGHTDEEIEEMLNKSSSEVNG